MAPEIEKQDKTAEDVTSVPATRSLMFEPADMTSDLNNMKSWQEDGLDVQQRSLKTPNNQLYDSVVRYADILNATHNLPLLLANTGFVIIQGVVNPKAAEDVGQKVPIFAKGGFEGKSSTSLFFCSFVVSYIPTPL